MGGGVLGSDQRGASNGCGGCSTGSVVIGISVASEGICLRVGVMGPWISRLGWEDLHDLGLSIH
ncbi:hypothetical protein BDY21DRAFT_354490 [Lineolata rhizophorae]|uniref:Uncharacterized protein n=1 Tax=Lineolata rhizophorae TaxID=578093 RepID=A0A6A6NQE3_9PEZI|nr:hypothetical protein BDY21DRAFT_354490 [Lineolata rhizophorae]